MKILLGLCCIWAPAPAVQLQAVKATHPTIYHAAAFCSLKEGCRYNFGWDVDGLGPRSCLHGNWRETKARSSELPPTILWRLPAPSTLPKAAPTGHELLSAV